MTRSTYRFTATLTTAVILGSLLCPWLVEALCAAPRDPCHDAATPFEAAPAMTCCIQNTPPPQNLWVDDQ